MKKNPIGVLDGGLEGLTLFESLVKSFPNETFIYINDLNNYPYEGQEINSIIGFVKENVEILLKSNISVLLVISNSIIEYCLDYLQTLKVPVINIVDTLIEYVNEEYEHKNILFLAKEYIIKANLYQKNFKYNHLYNIYSEELESLITNGKIKTADSFSKVYESFKTNLSKDIELVIYIDSYLKNLMIEFKEYFPNAIYLDLCQIIANVLKKKITLSDRSKGKCYCISNISSDEFIKRAYFVDLKYYYYERKILLSKKNKLFEVVND